MCFERMYFLFVEPGPRVHDYAFKHWDFDFVEADFLDYGLDLVAVFRPATVWWVFRFWFGMRAANDKTKELLTGST